MRLTLVCLIALLIAGCETPQPTPAERTATFTVPVLEMQDEPEPQFMELDEDGYPISP